jgi:hypothetical protein
VETLTRLSGVNSMRSSACLDEIKSTIALPLQE